MKIKRYHAADMRQAIRKVREELGPDAVIVATGWRPYDATNLTHLGYGTCPNVITNVMMERLAAPNGPTGGKILRPADQKAPESVAFVQCAGSRDENHLPYCSYICCMASMKQMTYLRKRYPNAKIYVFYIDLRTPGKYEHFREKLRTYENAQFIKGKVAKISQEGGDLVVEAEDTASLSVLEALKEGRMFRDSRAARNGAAAAVGTH